MEKVLNSPLFRTLQRLSIVCPSCRQPRFPSSCTQNASGASNTSEIPASYAEVEVHIFTVDFQNLSHSTKGRMTAVDWAYIHHKSAVAVVCGQHDALEAVQSAKAIIRQLSCDIRTRSNTLTRTAGQT